jgi:hypothetical protein
LELKRLQKRVKKHSSLRHTHHRLRDFYKGKSSSCWLHAAGADGNKIIRCRFPAFFDRDDVPDAQAQAFGAAWIPPALLAGIAVALEHFQPALRGEPGSLRLVLFQCKGRAAPRFSA